MTMLAPPFLLVRCLRVEVFHSLLQRPVGSLTVGFGRPAEFEPWQDCSAKCHRLEERQVHSET